MTVNQTKILHFSLGPVQGFVAEARRTRDLWGGSFLLSWLSGHAMKTVMDAGGTIVFPIVHGAYMEPNDPLLKAMITGVGTPRIGTLPNRFKAIVPLAFNPDNCSNAIRVQWAKVCNAVWSDFVLPIAHHGQTTKDIWDRQTNNFWDIAWVCDVDPGDASDNAWLDLRKNWRSHRPPDEGGDHCMVMGDWQEVSGFIRSRQRQRQDNFWQQLRSQKQIGKLDIRDDERLCAISLVKRLFPKVAEKVIGWKVDCRNWPSTSYMAAIPWLPQAWCANRVKALEFVELVKSLLAEGFGERNTHIGCLDLVATSDKDFKEFAGLDGNLFQSFALANEKLTPLKDGVEAGKREELLNILKGLKAAAGKGVSPYYALLIMDGDKMGAQLREYPHEVSSGLARFTSKVDWFVTQHNGVTIYAGGDDVLAMFPLDDAIPAALELRKVYCEAFNNAGWASISAAIIYAHHQHPLRSVLTCAHQQLKEVAKEKNGRDSLALALLKSGGINAAWVACWKTTSGDFPAADIMLMSEELAKDPQFSSRFLYALRDRFRDLIDHNGVVAPGVDMTSILLAEYLKNREKNVAYDEASRLVECLVRTISSYPSGSATGSTALQTSESAPIYTESVKNSGSASGSTVLQTEGPVLIRFLARKGVDE